jgi:hypothetical protein
MESEDWHLSGAGTYPKPWRSSLLGDALGEVSHLDHPHYGVFIHDRPMPEPAEEHLIQASATVVSGPIVTGSRDIHWVTDEILAKSALAEWGTKDAVGHLATQWRPAGAPPL